MKKILKGDESLNLAPIQYPQAYKTFKAMLNNFWQPSEVSVGKDASTFKSGLSSNERHVFLHVFAQLSTMDMLACDLHGQLLERFTSPEHKLVQSVIVSQEAIHSHSYQYIAEHLGLDEKWLWSRWKEVPCIKDKIDFANTVFTSDDIPLVVKYFFLAAIYEGLWFLYGFTPIFAIAESGKMQETIDIVKYICRDEDCHRSFGLNTIKEIGEENGLHLSRYSNLLEDICRQALALEGHYIDFLFKEGRLLALDAEMWKSQLRYSLQQSLDKVNVAIDIGEGEPIGWLTTALFAKKDDNIFERVPNEYQPLPAESFTDVQTVSSNTEWDDPLNTNKQLDLDLKGSGTCDMNGGCDACE